MANKKRYKLKGVAYPTHILVPDDTTKKERVMYACEDGAVIFSGGKQPKRNCSYRLVPNKGFEAYQKELKLDK